jgi:isoleucyl-tRNA synthetase
MRKEAGFEVLDRINVYYSDNSRISDVFIANADEIKKDVLAENIADGELKGYSKSWDINGENVTLAVEKI